MKLPRRRKLNGRQQAVMLLGIVLLASSAIFGGLKFYDIFHSESPQDDVRNQPVDSILSEQQPVQEESSTEEPAETTEQKPSPEPKPQATSNGPADEVGSYNWVVNKQRPLNPKTYVPPNLVFPDVVTRVPGNESMKVRADVAIKIKELFNAALTAGHSPMLSSAYRSYSYQSTLYNSYVSKNGQQAADTFSARPGHSEHQTGLAFDICNAGNCNLEQSFGTTPLGQWVAANAHNYGFTIRYKQGKENITGYTYEPWHLRYVGIDLAAQLFQSGKTLEEHFGLPPAPNY